MSRAKERQRLSWEGMFYSIQRIDLLVISICGAGIYVCFETIKFLSEKDIEISNLIKVSGILFTIGIMINFVSQLLGHKANELDFLMCEEEINAGSKISDSEQEIINKYDKASEKFSKWTTRFNYASTAAMFLGLGFLMYYFLFTF